MLLPSKKSLLPPDLTLAILAEFPQPVPLHRNFAVFHHAFPDEAWFLERPSCSEWCFLGQSEAPFRVFPRLLSRKLLENNDLFAIRLKIVSITIIIK